MPNITTSISQEMWNLAREKHLKWSECIERGIREIAALPFVAAHGEKIIHETELAKKERALMTMQNHILELTDALEKEKANRNTK